MVEMGVMLQADLFEILLCIYIPQHCVLLHSRLQAPAC